MTASWAYGYADLNELTDKSDLIALVKITGIDKEHEDTGIYFTGYKATVEQSIYNTKDSQNIIILITGINNDSKHKEIIDDPLPNKGDEFLIFAHKNIDGTYSILGGPQGRFYYKDGKVNSLQNVTDRVKGFNINVKDGVFTDIKSKIQDHKKVKPEKDERNPDVW